MLNIKLPDVLSTIKIIVHYETDYNNRFWDGGQVVLGDGDGVTFVKFSGLDSIAGAIAMPIIGELTKLPFRGQQGSIVEHLSDTLASMVTQWHDNQTVVSASWLIGSGMLSPKYRGQALRSMKALGSAYDNPILGKDPQPAHMKDYVKTTVDNGGVHINCGIPNHAFYLAAVEIGGVAWDKIGKVWINSLESITPKTNFNRLARITFTTARKLYGNNSNEANAVQNAWSGVGINVPVVRTRASRSEASPKRTVELSS